MRTTVTLEDDLAVRLEQYRVRSGDSFKRALNHALRVGLGAMDAQSAGTAEVRQTEPLRLGRRVGGSIDNVAEALAVAEGDDFR